jgi:hypothetical protein
VLLVDNELHDETIQDRIPRVADALGITLEEYGDHLDVLTLRGRLKDINALGADFSAFGVGKYKSLLMGCQSQSNKRARARD